MKKKSNKKTVYLLSYVFLCVIVLAIGYAVLTTTVLNNKIKKRENYIVNTTSFDVHYVKSSISPRIISGIGTASISDDNRTAYFDVTGLTKKGDKAIVEYVIYNEPIKYDALLDIQISNTNNEYFKVTKKLEDNLLKEGTATILTITIELTKTPVKDVETTKVSGVIVASPKQ